MGAIKLKKLPYSQQIRRTIINNFEECEEDKRNYPNPMQTESLSSHHQWIPSKPSCWKLNADASWSEKRGLSGLDEFFVTLQDLWSELAACKLEENVRSIVWKEKHNFIGFKGSQ